MTEQVPMDGKDAFVALNSVRFQRIVSPAEVSGKGLSAFSTLVRHLCLADKPALSNILKRYRSSLTLHFSDTHSASIGSDWIPPDSGTGMQGLSMFRRRLADAGMGLVQEHVLEAKLFVPAGDNCYRYAKTVMDRICYDYGVSNPIETMDTVPDGWFCLYGNGVLCMGQESDAQRGKRGLVGLAHVGWFPYRSLYDPSRTDEILSRLGIRNLITSPGQLRDKWNKNLLARAATMLLRQDMSR